MHLRVCADCVGAQVLVSLLCKKGDVYIFFFRVVHSKPEHDSLQVATDIMTVLSSAWPLAVLRVTP